MTDRQHTPLRVPQGWTGQDKALVIQIEELFTALYRKFGRIRLADLSEELQAIVTAEIPLAANGTRGGVQIGYTENDKNYALKLDDEQGYVTVPWTDTDTLNTAGAWKKNGTKLYLIGAENQSTNPTTNSNSKCYVGTDNCLYSNETKVLTSHQDISGKADKTETVTSVAYDGTKITETINGTTTDVVTVATLKSNLGAFTWGQLANQS